MANEDFSKEDSEEELYVPLKLKRGFKTKKMVTRNFKDMEDEDFWKEDSEEQLSVPLKSKRRVKTKKMEYDGWGSKPLIEFLKEIGVETENKISQWDLTTIVNEYVAKKKLNSQLKKNRVICDNWLRYLFGKKFVLRIKIHELLYPHLAENRDESADEDSNNSEEEEENKTAATRKRKALCLNSKKLPETPTSCFASIIPENIKLVYLRRSLIEELLKDPDTFESKVVGSYVRIKCDPNDCSQKNSHQLLQVTGLRKAPEWGDGGAEYFLEATHFFKETPLSELSNDHFKTEECDDLRQRIITGSFRRPTVMEFQQKAQILHKFITKQWISRELTLLQNQIEHANIKGWQRELHEYLKRKELLQKPAEQERLLLEVPNVIAEPLEPEVIVHEPAEDENTDKCCLRQSTIAGISEDVPFEADKSLSNDNSCSTDPAVLHKRYVMANLINMMTVMADKQITGDTTSGVQTLDDKKNKKSDTPSAGTDGTADTEAVKSDVESPKKKKRDRSKGNKEPKSGRSSRKKNPRTSVEKKSPTAADDDDDEDGENPNEEFLQSGGRQVVNNDEYEGGNGQPLPAHFFSVARGERDPVMNLTQPEGEEGWSMMDFRTYEGFSSDKGRKPTDALKAFEIPADQARYGAMPTREFFERSYVALGESISYQVHIHKMLHDTLHKVVSAERQVAELVVDKDDLGVKVKGMETMANNLKKNLEDRDEEIKNLKADKNKLTANLEKALEEARTKADEDRKENERLRNVVESSYRDHVRNFVNTQGFVDFMNARAAPALAIGYDSCAEFTGEGNTFVSDKHGFGAFLNWVKANPDVVGKMKSNRHAEPPLTASADKKFEIGVKQIESFVGKADKTDSEHV